MPSIAPLVYDNDKDSSAKMFDLLMFDLIISLINGYKKQNAINEKIIKTANKLKKQTSIPQVKEKMNVLQKISQKDY